ncbi:unnamed protein product [Echinostoma caproni]|uniref:Endo/exonuclease/phosphatase domain-containing protein n=1 Tax=Echinostoma caproni TaxID=27848 RepID=A0A183BG90_9TREM|nr:unnamed protein product [Echinostoma caproni]
MTAARPILVEFGGAGPRDVLWSKASLVSQRTKGHYSIPPNNLRPHGKIDYNGSKGMVSNYGDWTQKSALLIYNATIASKYRSPGATIDEDEQLIRALDALAQSQQKLVIAGDFNIPGIQWTTETCFKGTPAEMFLG